MDLLISTYKQEKFQMSQQTIRKISVGKDYKNDAMHYAVGQEVYGGHTIAHIIRGRRLSTLYTLLKKIIVNALERFQQEHGNMPWNMIFHGRCTAYLII